MKKVNESHSQILWPNTSGYDLGTLTVISEDGEEFLETELSLPWIDLSLLIWSLQQLAVRGGSVTFSASAASFDVKMSMVDEELHLDDRVCSFQAFAQEVLDCAKELLVHSESVPMTDAGRADLKFSVRESAHVILRRS